VLRAVPGPDLCSLIADPDAQRLWDRVYEAIEQAGTTLNGICWLTVSGQETRADLQQAAGSIEAAIALLKRTSAREDPWFDELERLAPRQIWHNED
jgi:hypothetical protein